MSQSISSNAPAIRRDFGRPGGRSHNGEIISGSGYAEHTVRPALPLQVSLLYLREIPKLRIELTPDTHTSAPVQLKSARSTRRAGDEEHGDVQADGVSRGASMMSGRATVGETEMIDIVAAAASPQPPSSHAQEKPEHPSIGMRTSGEPYVYGHAPIPQTAGQTASGQGMNNGLRLQSSPERLRSRSPFAFSVSSTESFATLPPPYNDVRD
ncbi:hypothetical protein NM688_g1062 [Phlebia brevispora]|uniref:Uncharacterized protein n=1 Tax=Phlebia brevispora TaxID=194682 RepID=A0ACC1TDA5_9APHY|nr:hypothetical protein NM688_g1062 [Phlebia brevispora]